MDFKTCNICFNQKNQIANLEKVINQSSVYFYQSINKIVKGTVDDVEQNLIKGVAEQWEVIKKLHSCAETHIKDISNYLQFYQELKDAKTEMNQMILRVEKTVALNLENIGNKEFLSDIDNCLGELLFDYQFWAKKLHQIAEKSRRIVHPSERLDKIQFSKPISALCDFRAGSYDVKENEDLILIDNEDPYMWKVSNLNKSHQFHVPSVICRISPPNNKNILMSNEILVEFLKSWTINIKRIGKNLILYLIYVVWNFTSEEIECMKSLSEDNKQIIFEILDTILKDLSPIWGGFKGHNMLREQINSFKSALQCENFAISAKNNNSIDERFIILRDAMHKFQNLWNCWSFFHKMVSYSLESDYILSVSKISDLKMMNRENLKDMWQRDLEFDQEEHSYVENWMEELKQYFTKVKANREERKQEKLEAEELMQSEAEEKTVFTITGVHNARTGMEISLQRAVSLGIIDQNTGMYVNLVDLTSMPIPEAMNLGFIKVEVTKVRKTKEKKSDMGLITIQTKLESTPYNVLAVIDSKNGQRLTIDEALSRGIVDLKKGVYYERNKCTTLSLSAALDLKLLEVEFDKDTVVKKPEMVSQVYAIYTVRDQMRREDVGFSVAVNRGILDQNTGNYYDNVKRQSMYITKAIKNGFIQAKKVDKNGDDVGQ